MFSFLEVILAILATTNTCLLNAFCKIDGWIDRFIFFGVWARRRWRDSKGDLNLIFNK